MKVKRVNSKQVNRVCGWEERWEHVLWWFKRMEEGLEEMKITRETVRKIFAKFGDDKQGRGR